MRWWRGRRSTPRDQGSPVSPNVQPQVRHLWGKEFSVTQSGLDEAQVTSFVNDLLARYNVLLQEQEETKSLRGFTRQVLDDTERQAASLRARAKRDAEVEAARILSEAQRQASQTVAQAKQRSEEITGQEVQEMLQAARRQAELVERQARIAAQRFLLQVREEVQGQVTSEVQSAYYRLLNTLQELLAAGQNVEAEWRSKTYQLLSAAPLELEHYQSRFLENLGAESLTMEGQRPLDEAHPDASELPLEPTTSEVRQVPTREETPPPRPQTREVRESPSPTAAGPAGPPPGPTATVAEMAPPAEDKEEPRAVAAAPPAPDLLQRPLQEAPAPPQVALEPEVVPPSPVREAVEELLRHRPHPDVSGLVVPRPGLPNMEEEPRVAPQAPPQKKTISPAVEQLPVREDPPQRAVPMETMPGSPADASPPRDLLYQGEVDLVMEPSVDFHRVAKLYGHIQSLRGLQILRTTGDWSEGTIITVVLDTPTPLITLLESVPNVRAAPDVHQGKGRGETAKGEKRTRIAVNLEGDL